MVSDGHIDNHKKKLKKCRRGSCLEILFGFVLLLFLSLSLSLSRLFSLLSRSRSFSRSISLSDCVCLCRSITLHFVVVLCFPLLLPLFLHSPSLLSLPSPLSSTFNTCFLSSSLPPRAFVLVGKCAYAYWPCIPTLIPPTPLSAPHPPASPGRGEPTPYHPSCSLTSDGDPDKRQEA